MRTRFSAVAGLALLAFLPLATSLACGGRVTEGPFDGGNPPGTPAPSASNPPDAATAPPPSPSSSPTGGSSSGSNFPICPGDPPKAGWTCPTPHQGCAYVDVKAGTCVSWTCDASGHWVLSTPAGC